MEKNKNSIRKQYLKIRNSMKKSYIKEKSEKIWGKILKTNEFKNCESIFIFISFGNEIYTKDFIKNCINLGKTVCVPIIKNKNYMEFSKINNLKDLKKNNFGILEPIYENIFKSNEKTLIIVPAVVYSKQNFRIGYGGGYYDNFLKNNKFFKSFGVCLKQFLINEIPIENYDEKVDFVFTD